MKEDIRIFSTRCWSVFWDVVHSLKLVDSTWLAKINIMELHQVFLLLEMDVRSLAILLPPKIH